jgi:hypothetical protein
VFFGPSFDDVSSFSTSVMVLQVGIKVERKLSDFSVKKWKRNENMKMETEFSRNGNGNSLAEVETETEQRFPVEQMRKRKLPFLTNMEFPFMVVLMANLACPIYDLVILNRQNNSSPTPSLHRVIVTGLGHKFFDFLDFLEFFCMIQVVSWFRQSSVFRPRLHRIRSIFVSESICFHICFRCFRIRFCFRIKI